MESTATDITVMWYQNPAVWASFVSAITALISTIFAGLAYRRKSTREMLDIVKADILVLVSNARTSDKEYGKVFSQSPQGLYINKDSVRALLSKHDNKYQRKTWFKIIEAAFEELKLEGFQDF